MTSGIGNIKLVNFQIEWEIPNFSKIIEKSEWRHMSPTYSFPDVGSLHLQFLFRSEEYPGSSRLFIQLQKYAEFFQECNFSFDKMDGHRTFLKGIKKKDTFGGITFNFEQSELQQLISDMPPSGVPVITCIYKPETAQSIQPNSIMEKEKNKKLKSLDILSQNFKDLFLNEASCDASLFVKEKEYKAHRAVLIARSSVFAAMFLHETSEKQTGIVTIRDCDPESFQQFLEFLYCAKIEELPSSCNWITLYETSNKYNVLDLESISKENLIENLSIGNVCDVATIADKYDDSVLMSASQNFFNENFNDVVQSSEWESLLKINYRLANELLKKMPKIKLLK